MVTTLSWFEILRSRFKLKCVIWKNDKRRKRLNRSEKKKNKIKTITCVLFCCRSPLVRKVKRGGYRCRSPLSPVFLRLCVNLRAASGDRAWRRCAAIVPVSRNLSSLFLQLQKAFPAIPRLFWVYFVNFKLFNVLLVLFWILEHVNLGVRKT